MKGKFFNLKKVLAVITVSFFSMTYAQMTVEGTVTSAEGFPETDAKVSVEGGKPVFTDTDGKYNLKIEANQAKKGKVTVTVEGVNGATTSKTLKYQDKAVRKNNFELNAITLDEVVAIGYGTAKKKDLSGAVVSFKPDKDDAKMASSLDDLLHGKVAGVNIISGGSTPGAAGSVTIRGANSLTGDSQPLYVIDNVPQSSTGQVMGSASGDFQAALDPLAGINPNDIEDIQILKDASATAIYGSRGANGVILITTKKGKMGKMRVSLGSKITIAQVYGLQKLMNLRELATYLNAKHPKDQKFEIGDQGVMYVFESTDDFGVKQKRRVSITERDWQKEALRAGVSQEYNVNINGGSNLVRYNLSASYKDVNGIVQNTGFKHGDMRLNLTSDLTDKLTLGLNLSGFLRRNNMMSGGNAVGRPSGSIVSTALNAWPFVVPREDDEFYKSDDNRTTVFSWITDFDNINNEYKFTASTDLKYKFSPNLSYTLRAGGNLNNLESESWFGQELYKGQNNNGYYGQSRLQRNNYNVENLLFYRKNFGFVELDATGGITYDVYKFLNTSLEATDFPFYVLRTNGLHTANRVKINNPIQKDYQLLSYLTRMNLSFLKGKYILTGTFRADGTSKFAEGNRWGYFPSFAAAWNVNQEEFLSDAKWLSQFKLRAGYGVTGSQNIDPYSSIFLYSSGAGYADATGTILQGMQVDINNPNLKWETTSSINAGTDFSLFDGRLSGSVDLYTKNTRDLLVRLSLPGSTSFNSLPVNKGEIENKGIEIALNGDIFRSKDFTWSIGGNIAKNRTKIVSMGVAKGDIGTLKNVGYMFGTSAGDHFGAPNIFIEGEAPGLFFGFKTDGIVQEGDNYVVNNPFKGMDAPGNLKVVDANGDGVVDLDDRVIIGDPNPDFTYGFQTNIKYKQFRFKTSFTGVQGGDVFNAEVRYRGMAMEYNGDRNLRPEVALNAWTPNNKSNYYPSVSSKVASYAYDRYIEDGSYLRCSDITVGYTLPKSVISQIKLSNVDFFASVKNAFTISNYSGYDPTSRSFGFDPLRRGLDIYSFPMQRAYILGVNVMF